jgi:TPR repeat protein
MDAQYALAGLYVEGVGVVADDAQAARWYGEAAHNGHVGAEIEYAIMLFNGRGVPKDEALAARWFADAARADNPVAQVRFARLLAEGRGTDKDEAEAARWYLIAKQRGFRDDVLDGLLTRLDRTTLEEANTAAERWARFRRHEPRTAEAMSEGGPAVDKQAE